MTVALAFMVLVVALRFEHIIASNVWIYRRGRDYKAQVAKWLDKDKHARISQLTRANAFMALGGGRLPQLFFGIQSSRLVIWHAKTRSSLTRSLLLLLRACWRYYTFSLLVSTLLFVLAASRERLSGAELYLTWAGGILLTLAGIGTVAGVAIAWTVMGSTTSYHMLNGDLPPEGGHAIADASLIVGAVMMTFISSLAATSFTSLAFGKGSTDVSTISRVLSGQPASVLAVISQPTDNPEMAVMGVINAAVGAAGLIAINRIYQIISRA